ncbi:helix-hairpin-helix domain-containing protein [Methanomethylovorans sp.]|uniref:helix-hairpin-helix domain-containing protein n=1 Tax=Methanomethylovorans sp. TaxID=2758717 RepID=UPI00345E4F28
MKIDRCMLYVFRCAIYCASNEEHDPQLLKWWSWKDNKIPAFTTYQENKTTSNPPDPAPGIP